MNMMTEREAIIALKNAQLEAGHRIEGLEMDNQIYSREREKSRATTARFAEAITTLRREGDAEAMVARLREILLHNVDVEARR